MKHRYTMAELFAAPGGLAVPTSLNAPVTRKAVNSPRQTKRRPII